MTQKEYQIFKDRVMNRLTGEEANHSISQIMENDDSEDQTINVQAVKKGITARNRMEIKDKPQFKRKRAKVIIYPCAVSVSQLEFGYHIQWLIVYIDLKRLCKQLISL